ncbi:NAD-dependent succinate-semialdehyde dehydrogenase [Noviherbaspirillum sp. CPCC 100848]|uniref:NAD-dependent succinate-semialdehyde dehydrogenase n=1 Tax=Noviherbaspirillum album TaxID=3080276 RepID=A0ABU6JGN8_9BURK|nr:NAD-dependent succinate-semialdehyde dehydrogenase [Noviherbaspirillum sp. CPCC 100848]MEC4722829.1 NAD-dependent succinate-semialdehyde dehydrogenase [Noviherbaspirillum sp. CPCC 100848]
MTIKFPLVIDGQWRAGSSNESQAVLNPATGESLGLVAHATLADLDEALAAATRGMREWQVVSPWERGTILKKAADILRANIDSAARTITLEQGKPLAESKGEVGRSADFLEWGGEQARRISGRFLRGRDTGHRIEIETHPVGVVAAFTPWNFPMALAAKKFAGALGAGCSIICKPSEETPGSVLVLAKALLDAGVPPAAIGVVFGRPDEISSYLIPAPAVAKVTFTGSIPVGKLLAATAGKAMKPVTMELGGHAPTIVCADVDPEKVADFLAKAKFTNAGQICLSPTRFFVEESVRERFTTRLAQHAKAWRVGDGLDPQTQMGPLANERRVHAMSHLVDDTLGKGGKVAAGGQRIGDRGFFFAPTVLAHVPDDAEILRSEPFGPVVPVLGFTDEDAMLSLANGLEFGLSGYVFTNDASRQQRIKDSLHFGTVGVNDVATHIPEVPLGGWKESGYGTEGGIEILEPYQKTKFLSIR